MKPILDAKDKRILDAIDMNARISLSALGKRVGLRKEVVNYRIRNLLRTGVIKGFHTVIDATKLGYLSFRLFLRMQNMTENNERAFVAYLKKNPPVGWLVSCQGGWDYNLIYWAKSVYDFERFERELLEKYGRFIAAKWVSIFTRIHHFPRPYLDNPEGERREFVVGGSPASECDDMDLAILLQLADNARKPTVDIAKAVGLSPKMVRERMRRMLKQEVIQGYRPIVDLGKLGFGYYKAHFTLQNVSKVRLNNLFEYCKAHPNVIYIDETIGGADFEIEIQARDNEHLRAIISSVRHGFADIIRDVSTLTYYEEHKFVYLPPTKTLTG